MKKQKTPRVLRPPRVLYVVQWPGTGYGTSFVTEASARRDVKEKTHGELAPRIGRYVRDDKWQP